MSRRESDLLAAYKPVFNVEYSSKPERRRLLDQPCIPDSQSTWCASCVPASR